MDFKVTLYKPVEVDLEGQKFRLRKLNRAMFRKLAEFAALERAAKDVYEAIEVVYDELKAFLDAPADVIDDLDDRQVTELKNIIEAVVFKRQKNPETAEETAEKNGPRPGEEAAAG